jgi:CheY-specific phosphatase CheX
MDVKNINAFTEVVVGTFETAVNSAPHRRDDFKRAEGDISNGDGVLCSISFSGALNGALVVVMPETTARKVYSALMFEEVQSVTDEVKEAFVEIFNMITGNVRAALSGTKLNFQPPSVLSGKNAVFQNPDGLAWLEIPMAFKDWGDFTMWIGVR